MIIGESPLKDLYRLAIWGPGRGLLAGLPPGQELRLLERLGRCSAAALPRRQRRVAENLRRALPELAQAEAEHLAVEVFGAHFCNQYWSFCVPQCTAATWGDYLDLRGRERLREVRRRGRGALLLHLHMGPAQLPLHVLGLLGLPTHQIGGGRVTQVQLSKIGQRSARLRAELEKAMPVTLHDGRAFLRPVLRALAANELVLTAADATGGGEELGRRQTCPVLGLPYALPLGPIKLARASGAPVLPLICARSREAGGPPWVATIGPELELPRDRDGRLDLEGCAAVLAAWLEGVLRQHPGDWLFWDGLEPGGLLADAKGPVER
jgi:KDO2-lipid IV(A) lauroyltransferase